MRQADVVRSRATTDQRTRVGIMSMQRILNYGSTLQAYGLRRLIEQACAGAEVSFLDYRPGAPLIDAGDRRSPVARALAKAREYAAVDAPWSDRVRFLNHKRTYARRHFPQVGIPPESVHDLGVDVQVIGSDEVFNCVQSNANVGFARDLFGHGSKADRVVSYAASFGNTTVDKIDAFSIRDHLVEDFGRFAHISVRDRNSADIVENLIGRRPEIHLDPVLAYDYLKNEPRIPSRRIHEPKYMIVYGYPGRISAAENRALAAIARRRGLEVLAFGGVQTCADRFVDCDPFELLAYFRDAEAVVTDTFHGTIFSIINGTPFGTLVRPTVGDGYGNEEKLGHLLETFGLQGRRVDTVDGLSETPFAPFETAGVQRVLDHERGRTRSYLQEALAS